MIVIKFQHIRTIQHDVGNGITNPKLAITDENVLVIIKTFNGPEGQLVLFNELFCYRLAILLGLPMPPSGVCLVDKNTEVYNNCINDDQYGYGFYSTYLHKSTVLVETIISLITNKEVFYRIVLFDHIIFNSDRNPGNLLVQYYKNNVSLMVIDHSHVFINQAVWDDNCLNRAIDEKDYYSTRVLEDNSILYGMFFRHLTITEECFEGIKEEMKNIVTEESLRSIVSDIPKEWLPPDRNIEALIRYILYRVEHIDDITITILNYLRR